MLESTDYTSYVIEQLNSYSSRDLSVGAWTSFSADNVDFGLYLPAHRSSYTVGRSLVGILSVKEYEDQAAVDYPIKCNVSELSL